MTGQTPLPPRTPGNDAQGMEILVGVDGSTESDAALIWAVAEAHARGCGLAVVHCCESRYYGLWTTTRLLREGLRDMARPIVADALALAASLEPFVPVRGAVLVTEPTGALVRLSAHAALVVIGRPDRGALSRLLLGSITRYLLANAACPVVAVRTAGGIARVVAAVTDPDADEQTVAFAVAEAEHHHVPVQVAVASATHGGSLAETVASLCTATDLLVLGHCRHGHAPHHLEHDAVVALSIAPGPVAVVREPRKARTPGTKVPVAAQSNVIG
jgi:nucleotide-binding universal stress UspA family protein